MLKSHLNDGTNIDGEKIRQKISEQPTDDLVGKISYKNENVKLKVTYELECNSSSGEIKFGNLIDVIDIKTVENIENNKSQTLINEYLENGNLLKSKQIESLLINDFHKIASLFENEPLRAKKLLKDLPSIGRITYRSLVEFLSNSSNSGELS